MLEGELVCEVAGQGHGDGHESEREVDGLSTVAPVSLALAHEGVVLLEDGLEINLQNNVTILKHS